MNTQIVNYLMDDGNDKKYAIKVLGFLRRNWHHLDYNLIAFLQKSIAELHNKVNINNFIKYNLMEILQYRIENDKIFSIIMIKLIEKCVYLPKCKFLSQEECDIFNRNLNNRHTLLAFFKYISYKNNKSFIQKLSRNEILFIVSRLHVLNKIGNDLLIDRIFEFKGYDKKLLVLNYMQTFDHEDVDKSVLKKMASHLYNNNNDHYLITKRNLCYFVNNYKTVDREDFKNAMALFYMRGSSSDKNVKTMCRLCLLIKMNKLYDVRDYIMELLKCRLLKYKYNDVHEFLFSYFMYDITSSEPVDKLIFPKCELHKNPEIQKETINMGDYIYSTFVVLKFKNSKPANQILPLLKKLYN